MKSLIWDEEHECASREQIEKWQLEGLKRTVNRMWLRVAPYRAKMEAAGIVPEKIKVLSDLQYLPFMVKDDLRQAYPFGLFAEPQENVVRLHASSGTTGKPIVVGYTQNDLNMWTDLVARMVTQASVGKGDTAQVAFGYGLFTGGFGLHYGLERVGATVIPIFSSIRKHWCLGFFIKYNLAAVFLSNTNSYIISYIFSITGKVLLQILYQAATFFYRLKYSFIESIAFATLLINASAPFWENVSL